MSKFDEKMALYKAEFSKVGKSALDEALFLKVTKALGPSIYLEDASRVSCSDQVEKDRVKERFLIGKMGQTDGKNLDEAINAVCEEMGSSNKNKFRAIFYYMLVVKLGLAGKYA
jgi:Protein of unknown function (DUF2853)